MKRTTIIYRILNCKNLVLLPEEFTDKELALKKAKSMETRITKYSVIKHRTVGSQKTAEKGKWKKGTHTCTKAMLERKGIYTNL